MDNKVSHVKPTQDTENTPLDHWSQYLAQTPFNDRERNSAQIYNLLQALIHTSAQGNSCLPISSAEISDLNDYIYTQEQAYHKVSPMVFDGELLALYRYWSLEYRLAQEVVRLSTEKIAPINLQFEDDLLTDEHQKNALKMVASKALNIITGGPGTGKTYTLARIIAVLNKEIPNIRIAMAAPTGKAAQRMQEALQHSFNDNKLQALNLVTETLKQQRTQTLHRLLGLGHQSNAKYNKKQPLPYDVVVVDEASMLDLNLATLLFEAIAPNSRLILLGDAQQLASVDVGAVLADLQQVQALDQHRVNLVTSRRFSGDALVGKFAKFIHNVNPKENKNDILSRLNTQICKPQALQQVTLSEDMADHIQIEFLSQQEHIDWLKHYDMLMQGFNHYVEQLKAYQLQLLDMQISDSLEQQGYPDNHVKALVQAFDQYRILVAVRFGYLGLDVINRYAQDWLLSRLNLVSVGGWYIGRPVMMTYNDYQLGVSNGDIGICLQHRYNNQLFEVYFPSLDKWVAAHRLPKNMQTAFALTIHKSQGSEFQHTAVVFNQSAQRLLSQELLYTAITRAKKVVSLLVDEDTFLQSLQTITLRHSGLIKKVNNEFSLTQK